MLWSKIVPRRWQRTAKYPSKSSAVVALGNQYNNHLSVYCLDLLDWSKMSLPVNVNHYAMASANVSWRAKEESERQGTVVVSEVTKMALSNDS